MIFLIDRFDAEFSRRTTPEEWRRIIAMRERPRFLEALKTYAALIPDYFSDNVILNKVVTEAWRFEMLVYMLYLHDQRDPRDPRAGLTASNLQKLCARQNCASPGRVTAILGMMWAAAFLLRKKSPADSRIVYLEPSRKFITIVEGWNHSILTIIDSVIPDDPLAPYHVSHPRFGWEMRARGAECLFGGWKLLDPFPEVLHFVSRDAGWMLLLHCVAESVRIGGGDTVAPVSVDLAQFGKRFGVSRSHLRRLLESAFTAGLLEAPPRNGANIVLSHKLVASFLTCMASELGNYRQFALDARCKLAI